MGSPKVSLEAIKEALTVTGGNVAETGRRLGLAPINVRKRLETACVDLEAFRGPGSQRLIVRLPDDQKEKLRQAAFDLAYLRRQEHTPDDVLAEFVREGFDEWLKTKVKNGGDDDREQ